MIVLALMFFFSADRCPVNAAQTIEEKDFYSKACVLLDGYSGRMLFGKQPREPLANASTTKILTCIITLEHGNVDKEISASKRAVKQPKVRLGMVEGRSYCVRDLLYCLMLESYNDCAVAIAESVAGTVEDFAALMNEKARKIGCEDSYFITPNGLDDKNEIGFHHTTALDLCRIMRYCAWESPCRDEFLEITRTMSYQFADGDGVSHSASNHNQLLTSMQGALSGKTGFTADAGYCYVMAYELDGKRFCASFLGCGWPNNKNYKWKDARKMMEYAQQTYEKKNIYRSPEIPRLTLQECHGKHFDRQAWGEAMWIQPYLRQQEQEVDYMLSEEDQISYKVRFENRVHTPLKEGDAIGAYEVRLNDEVVREYAILSDTYADTWKFYEMMRVVITSFLQGD